MGRKQHPPRDIGAANAITSHRHVGHAMHIRRNLGYARE